MSLLIRLYPKSWRDRYGEELACLLEDRPPGPSDVLDLVLGAFDAHLHRPRLGHGGATGTTPPPAVRVGSIAAIVGGVLWMLALVVAVHGHMADSNPLMVLAAVSMLCILVALAALSAVQSRAHPVLVWTSFLVPAVGVLLAVSGVVAQLAVGDRPVVGDLTPWVPWILGIVLTLVGCAIFALISTLMGGPNHRATAVLSVGAWVQLVSLVGHDVATDGDLMLAGAALFGIGWILVGLGASRAERAGVERPA